MSNKYSDDPIVEKSLRHSVKDGAAYSVMAGAGETYFSAYGVFLHATTAQIGFLASIPPILASVAQAFSAWLGHKTGRRKTIILIGASLQGLVWPFLALMPWWFPEQAVALLITGVVLFYACGNLALPQWSSLMGSLVAEDMRGRYFGRRTGISSMVSFFALVVAGGVLHAFEGSGYTQLGFVLIFTVAFIGRLVSVYHLMQMYDPPGHVAALEMPLQQSSWNFLKGSQFARFTVFFGLIQFSVAVASPFFSVYILRELHFSYLEFMALTAASVLVQFLALNRWGELSDAVGNRTIMAVCGVLIPFVPIMWLFSANFYYLLLCQAFAGFVWAGFSLAAGNFFYDLIPQSKRATFLAIQTAGASLGIFFGAMLGSYLGTVLNKDVTILGFEVHWSSGFFSLFLLSGVLRGLTAALFLPKIKEVRKTQKVSLPQLVFRISRFNPLTGLIFDVIGSRQKPSGRD